MIRRYTLVQTWQTENPKLVRNWQTGGTCIDAGSARGVPTNYQRGICHPVLKFAEVFCDTFGMALLNSEYFARHVRSRMAELGLTQAAVRERGGPSDTTLRKVIEGAPVGMTMATLIKLDTGLDWAKGSAARALAGGDPTPNNSPSDAFTRAVQIARQIVNAEPTPHDEYFSRTERLLTHAHESVRRADYLGAIRSLEGVESTVELLIDRVTDSATSINERPTNAVEVTQESSASAEDEDQKTDELERRRKGQAATDPDQAPKVDRSAEWGKPQPLPENIEGEIAAGRMAASRRPKSADLEDGETGSLEEMERGATDALRQALTAEGHVKSAEDGSDAS